MSDSSGTIYDKDGIKDDKLDFIFDLKNNRRGRIQEYSEKYNVDYLDGKIKLNKKKPKKVVRKAPRKAPEKHLEKLKNRKEILIIILTVYLKSLPNHN